MMTMTDTISPTESAAGARSLLLVDDDAPLLNRLARAMERRGFTVRMADSVASEYEPSKACDMRKACS